MTESRKFATSQVIRIPNRGCRVDLTFKSKRLAKLCSSESLLVAEFGPDCARKIARRLLVLEAAECLADVPSLAPDRRRELTGRQKGQFAVDAERRLRIIFLPKNNPASTNEGGDFDLTRVTSVELLEIEDRR